MASFIRGYLCGGPSFNAELLLPISGLTIFGNPADGEGPVLPYSRDHPAQLPVKQREQLGNGQGLQFSDEERSGSRNNGKGHDSRLEIISGRERNGEGLEKEGAFRQFRVTHRVHIAGLTVKFSTSPPLYRRKLRFSAGEAELVPSADQR